MVAFALSKVCLATLWYLSATRKDYLWHLSAMRKDYLTPPPKQLTMDRPLGP